MPGIWNKSLISDNSDTELKRHPHLSHFKAPSLPEPRPGLCRHNNPPEVISLKVTQQMLATGLQHVMSKPLAAAASCGQATSSGLPTCPGNHLNFLKWAGQAGGSPSGGTLPSCWGTPKPVLTPTQNTVLPLREQPGWRFSFTSIPANTTTRNTLLSTSSRLTRCKWSKTHLLTHWQGF